MIIFISKQKKFEGGLKIKLSGKGLYHIESIKHLVRKLIQQYHINDLSIKLSRANALLFKTRKYVLKNINKIHLSCYF